MKEGWEYKKLGDVCSFMSGYTPQKEELNNKSGVPYFKVSDMNRDENGYEMNRTELFVKRPKKIFPVGAIIFPKNGGAIFTEKKRFLVCDSIIDLNTEAILANESFLKKEYLFYLLTKIKISTFDNGGGLPSVNIKKMCDYEICIPPLPEQQSIVDYLDSAFAKIDAMKANAEKALNEAKALFQASLKKMMEPKEGWEEKKLCEVVNIINGYAFPSKAFGDNQELKVVKITNVGVGTFIEDISTLPNKMFIQDVCLKEGDIVIALTRTIISDGLKRAIIPSSYDGAMLNQRVASLRYSGNINMSFLYYYLGCSLVSDYVWLHVNTLMQPNLSIKDLKDLPVCNPPFSEQQSIVASLDSLKSKVDRLQENYNKISQECDALKQAILRKVFE